MGSARYYAARRDIEVTDIMQPISKPADHPPVPARRVGVLLMNLGTPEATDYWSMRRYLKEFLSDPRVIEVPKAVWWPVLNGIILTVRPGKSGHAYKSIWNEERNESPLKTVTRAQAEGVAAALKARHGDGVVVDWAMRYGQPAVGPAIQRLKDQGCDRILLFPLYPQYSATTTATANDQAFRHLMTMRWQPAVRTVPAYHDEQGYIDALARSVMRHIAALDHTPDVLLASFHGLPKAYLDRGDPYHCFCVKTARLLAERLGWEPGRVQYSFQSRFGKAEWLKPYTDKTVEELARAGKTKIAVIAPGFSADCVETLEEIQFQVKDAFMAAGGERFTYIPCLNDHPDHVTFLADLVERELGGWVDGARTRVARDAEDHVTA
ncbi:ferrochelatase [Azospirillum brasilense]|uniref:Ferrochelatase n=1 Tax=Azospirillum brasilense TaxID=192 RepID=A0A560BPP7_AZOBR|nr:ferrochelatase [Azospirillum brasilense]TWA74568.1 ferrochelatase [Azospirillum brasilense]